MTVPSSGKPPESSKVAQVVERNIQSLVERQQADHKQRTREEKIADAITHFAGSMRFIYLHIVVFGLWIAINLGWLPLPRFDPSLAILAIIGSFEAVFFAVFVLISQNRMAAQADARAKLDLQISLLAEHEVTQILKLVAGIAERVEVDLGEVTELSTLAQDIHPDDLMETIETAERDLAGDNKADKNRADGDRVHR
jgi:uncharacterized membrane protein